MPPTYPFSRPLALASRPVPRSRRPLGNKFQEIASRSPADMVAFEKLADLVLARLDQVERDALSP